MTRVMMNEQRRTGYTQLQVYVLYGIILWTVVVLHNTYFKAATQEAAIRNNIAHSRSSWSCPLQSDEVATKHQTPIVVFATPRTGSTLLVNMMVKINDITSKTDLELMNLDELFNPYHQKVKEMGISPTSTTMKDVCDMPNTVLQENDWEALRKGDVKKYIEAVRAASGDGWPKEMVAKFDQRFQDPRGLFQFVADIPSRSQNPFFVIKMFEKQLEQLTTQEFVEYMSNLGSKQTKFIIIWRRRLVESYASEVIAKKTGSWAMSKTTEDSAIIASKKDLKNYIETKRRYYTAIRKALVAANVDFEVFEYDRDMRDAPQQLKTMKRLVEILGLSEETVDLEKALHLPGLVKQAQVPLEKQVKNWDEVVKWGYGGEVDEWIDLFDS